MKKATKNERDKIVDILIDAFQDGPGIHWLIGGKKKSRVRALMEYSTDFAFHQGEIWLSDNEEGVMLLFHQKKHFSWLSLYLQIKLIVRSVGIKRLPKIMKRQQYVQSRHPTDRPFIYCWYLGIRPSRQNLEAIIDLRDGLFRMALQRNFPVYMETSVVKAVGIYKRYGFTEYHYWEMPGENLPVWFFIHEPQVYQGKKQKQDANKISI